MMTRGWVANRAIMIPVKQQETRVSDMPIILWVLSLRRPPKVMAVQRAAKYMNIAAARQEELRPSVKSET